MSATRPNVVIVGAGFGGIEAAKALRRAPVEVTLVDRHNHHLFQPLLYQVATAALSPADIAWPIRHILRGQGNATVLMAEVDGVDTAGRRVRARAAPSRSPTTTWSSPPARRHAYFGHDEWAELAPGLKTLDDATRIRRRILLAFEQAELAHDAAERQRLLTFVVIGGGADRRRDGRRHRRDRAARRWPREFRRIDPRTARIVLLEAGPRMLPTLAAGPVGQPRARSSRWASRSGRRTR